MSTIRRIRAALVMFGLLLALGSLALAPSAMASPPSDTNGGGGTSSTEAPPRPAPPTPAPKPPPDTCTTVAPPEGDGGHLIHKGVIIGPATTPTPAPPACDASGTTPTPTPGPSAPPSTPSGAPAAGATATSAPATPAPPSGAPATDAPAAATPSPAATSAPGPVIHNGVAFPASTEAPKPAIDAPTPALSALANAIVIRSRSVSTVVTVPAGLPVSANTEISILFGFQGSTRQTQTYSPGAGNRFVFDFDAGDGTARTEDVAVSLADRGDGSHVGFVSKVPVEALYDVSVSPLTFTLINDCSWFFQTEVKIGWRDDRGIDDDGQQFRMDPWESATMLDMARTLSGVSLRTSPQVPQIWFEHVDFLDIWAVAIPNPTQVPLVRGGTRPVTFQEHALGEEACNGTFRYSVTVSAPLTYRAL